MITMVTCKDCKHWGPEKMHSLYDKALSGWRECDLIDQTWCREPSDTRKAFLSETDDVTSLLTHPDFFCYHGAPR